MHAHLAASGTKVPFICLAVVLLLPYLLATYGGYYRKKTLGVMENHNPRAQAARLDFVPIWQCRAFIGAMLPSCPDCGQERLHPEDVHDAGEVVGEHVQGHLGSHLWQAFHQEVGCSHPHLERAEGRYCHGNVLALWGRTV